MEKERYNPQEAETKWQQFWEKNQTYKFDLNHKGKIFSIDTPPPTVSGAMHLGHAFSYSQQDFIARFKRMTGHNVFFPFGTDDNGLATIRLVQKNKKINLLHLSRKEAISTCLEHLEEIRPAFVQDWKNIGHSADFSIFYSTINDHSRKISQKSFLDLYKDGRIYQKKAPIIFCPSCKTAIAQVEMEDVEKKTTLNFIKAKLDDGSFMIYATTRPELHPGCVGLSINEEGEYVRVKRDDGELWIISKSAVERMQDEFPMEVVDSLSGKKLVGKRVVVPYAENAVRVSHDESANTEYGTGVVYYCSYGGLDCVEWMVRHPDVEPVHVMDESGTYTVGPAKGERSDKARKIILELLEKEGSLIKKQPMKHAVNVHERCQTDIEYVATKQWFIKYLDLRETFLKAGAKLHWYPKHMKVRYDNWIKGLKWDWCVSRQRHFGVPIPIWYDEKGDVVLPSLDQLPVDPLQDSPAGHTGKVTPEKDVLDTWATSSLTPHLAVELFEDEKLKKRLFPMSLRPQAHDIITFWLFNTLVKSQLHHNVNPWHDVVISGHAQDPHGKKMSKSKGNVIAPQDMIAKYGADALRFWAAGSKLGDDLPFQEKDLKTGMRFATKLWNAAKFSMQHLEGYKLKKCSLDVFDKWLLSKLQKVIQESTDSFEKYEYSKTKAEVEKFFWQLFCDQYLEIVKDRLYNPSSRGEEGKKAAQFALYTGLLSVVKMMAPITPYITEEVYQSYFLQDGAASVHVSSWPTVSKDLVDEKAEEAGDIGIDIIKAVRKWKSLEKMSMKVEISSLIVIGQDDVVKSIMDDLKAVLHVKEILFKGETDLVTEKFGIKIGIVK